MADVKFLEHPTLKVRKKRTKRVYNKRLYENIEKNKQSYL